MIEFDNLVYIQFDENSIDDKETLEMYRNSSKSFLACGYDTVEYENSADTNYYIYLGNNPYPIKYFDENSKSILINKIQLLECQNIKASYIKSCNKYLKMFCNKHDLGCDYIYAKNSWVGNDVGTAVYCGDYYVDMETIRYDIDNHIDPEEFFKYYNYCLEVSEFNLNIPNYSYWCNGHDVTSKETLQKLRDLKNELNNIIDSENKKMSE